LLSGDDRSAERNTSRAGPENPEQQSTALQDDG
jgi:hypothetical protein